MARLKDREKALALRKQEMSYSQIKKILRVSKSTLSYWLRDYPLSEKRIKELQKMGARSSEHAIEKFRKTMKEKKEKRLGDFYKQQKKLIFPIKKRELYIAGLFLYWGDGAKTQSTQLSLSNTDPAMIKFFIHWLTRCLNVPKEKLKIQLHLYKDMRVKKEIRFWSTTLGISEKQFNRPYIKKTSSKRINHKGSFGHGTCNIGIGNARLSEKTLMAIKAISDKYNKL